jgi:hypothetical protein
MWYKSSLLTNKSPLTKQTKTQLAQISFNSKCLFLIDDVIFIYYAMNDLTNVGIPLLITVCYIKEVHKRHALLYISLIITNQWCYQCVSLHVSHIKLGYLVLLNNAISGSFIILFTRPIIYFTYSNLRQTHPYSHLIIEIVGFFLITVKPALVTTSIKQ